MIWKCNVLFILRIGSYLLRYRILAYVVTPEMAHRTTFDSSSFFGIQNLVAVSQLLCNELCFGCRKLINLCHFFGDLRRILVLLDD